MFKLTSNGLKKEEGRGSGVNAVHFYLTEIFWWGKQLPVA